MELESETERARNGSEQHRVRAVDSLLQYRGQSATVPQTVRRSEIWKRTSRKQFCSRLKNHGYSTRGQSAAVPRTVRWSKKKENELRETGSVCCWKLNSGLSGVKGGLSAVQRSKTRLRKVVLDTLNLGWRTVREMLPDCLRIAILEE
jgi:hypothetical protein